MTKMSPLARKAFKVECEKMLKAEGPNALTGLHRAYKLAAEQFGAISNQPRIDGMGKVHKLLEDEEIVCFEKMEVIFEVISALKAVPEDWSRDSLADFIVDHLSQTGVGVECLVRKLAEVMTMPERKKKAA